MGNNSMKKPTDNTFDGKRDMNGSKNKNKIKSNIINNNYNN
jgi:hypothetical protein